MEWLVIVLASMLAGLIQSVTGFGAAICLMMIVPCFFDMVAAPALSSAISMGLSVTLSWRFRRYIDWKNSLPPTLIYLVFSLGMILVVPYVDLGVLTLWFGLFLVGLSLYFLVISDRLQLRANWKTAAVCSLLSGVTSGLFGIGGPLMALYFISATESKESYIGNIQFLFAVTNVVNLMMRTARGIYTVDLIPLTLVGFVGINLGKKLGLRILNRLDQGIMRKLVYAYVGVSGVVTVVQQLL